MRRRRRRRARFLARIVAVTSMAVLPIAAGGPAFADAPVDYSAAGHSDGHIAHCSIDIGAPDFTFSIAGVATRTIQAACQGSGAYFTATNMVRVTIAYGATGPSCTGGTATQVTYTIGANDYLSPNKGSGRGELTFAPTVAGWACPGNIFAVPYNGAAYGTGAQVGIVRSYLSQDPRMPARPLLPCNYWSVYGVPGEDCAPSAQQVSLQDIGGTAAFSYLDNWQAQMLIGFGLLVFLTSATFVRQMRRAL